jgi:UTP:GlnB (protein PII) uridylyltransferase
VRRVFVGLDVDEQASAVGQSLRLRVVGLDIRHATVQTIGPSVVDSFYVRTSDGAKVTDGYHRAEIERAVLHAVGSPS